MRLAAWQQWRTVFAEPVQEVPEGAEQEEARLHLAGAAGGGRRARGTTAELALLGHVVVCWVQ
jgi:hypothetical protein